MNFSFSLVSEGVETLPQAIVGPPEGTETLRTIRGSLSSPDRSQPLVLDDAIATKILQPAGTNAGLILGPHPALREENGPYGSAPVDFIASDTRSLASLFLRPRGELRCRYRDTERLDAL